MLVTQQNTSDKAKLVAKWRKMLEHKKMAPLSNRKKPIVASMLENLYKRSKGLIKEEKLTTADIQTFDTVLIPMIRRIAPELIALDILGTQVMEKPSQLIFALRAFPSGRKGDGCCYDTDKFGYEIPGGRVRNLNGEDRKEGYKKAQILVINKTEGSDGFFGKEANTDSGNPNLKAIMSNKDLYEKGYFKGQYHPYDGEAISIFGKNIAYAESETSDEKVVDDVYGRMVEGKVYYAEEDAEHFKLIVCYDEKEGGFVPEVSGDDPMQKNKYSFNEWMTVCSTDFIDTVKKSDPVDDSFVNCAALSKAIENEIMYNVVFKNYSGKYSTSEMEGFKTWNEVHFDIDSTMVKAEGRLLKARYSLEVAEDLMAYHNLDAEEELVNMISYEILAEMNREVVERIYEAALSNGNGIYQWSYGNFESGADGRWAAEKYHSLYTLMNKIAGDIAIANRRGAANFAITSMATKVALESVAGYSLWTDVNNNFNSSAGVTYAGTLAGKYKIYVDTFANSDYILMGYKGNSEYDAGLFYCPFIPLTAVKAIDPENFQPRLGFRTRYGIGENPFGANLYYRLCTIDGLDNSFGAEYTYYAN